MARTTGRPASSRLRVCYVVGYFFPFASGAERQAFAQGVELVRRGHEVHVLTQWVPWADLPADDEVQGIRIHRKIETSQSGWRFGASFVASALKGLKKLAPRIDLVHTHQAHWEAIATGLARATFLKRPCLVQPASSGAYGEAAALKATRGRSVLRRLALRNDLFAAISDDIVREWRALGVEDERIVRTSSGVDTARFRPGASAVEDRLPPRPRACFTGRLHPQKGLDLLIEAWPHVARETGASLVLVGDGPERSRLEAKVRELQITDRAGFVGSVVDPSEHLRACELFVLPSLAEGMSNSLLEAMASGCACVASEIGGNVDLLGAEGAGVLVAGRDPEAWSRVLIELFRDSEKREALGRAARARIEREFGVSVVVDRYLELYERLLAGDRGG